MRKTTYKILVIIMILLTLTGCWDSGDIEKKELIATVIVDYKEDYYYYHTEVINILGQSSKKNENSSKSNFSILSSKGKTLVEARDEYDYKADQPLFLGAARALVFTDRMATDIGIEEYLNRLRGQIDYRKSIYLITTPEEPLDLLNSTPENSPSIGFSIKSTLDSLKNEGGSINTNFSYALQTIADKKAGFLLPSFEIVDKELTFVGYSVFKDAKHIGEISADKIRGVIYLLNPKARIDYEVLYNNRKYIITVKLKDKKVTTNYKNGQLKIKTSMKFGATINYLDKMKTITKNDIKELEKKLEKQTIEDITQAIYTSQHEFSCDYLKFYKYFRAKHQADFETLDWSNKYTDALMEVETKVNINESYIPVK